MKNRLKDINISSIKLNFKGYFIDDFILSSHIIAAFLILPFFGLLIYDTDLPIYYFYITISYTVFFPFYLLICSLIKNFKKNIIYFFIFHLFGITLVTFIQLKSSNFLVNEMFCFFGFYCISIMVIHRWFALMFYNIFVFLLLMYGLINSEKLDFSIYLIVEIIVVLGLVSSLTLHAIKKRNERLKLYNNLLDQSLERRKSAFIIFELNPKRKIVNQSKNIQITLDQIVNTEKGLDKAFFSIFKKEDELDLINQKSGSTIKKKVYSKLKRDKRTFELELNKIENKSNLFIAFFTDITKKTKSLENYNLLEQKYENLFYKNKAGVFTLNMKGELTRCNSSFLEIFENNYKIGDLLFFNEIREEWDFILDTLNQTGNSYNYQTQLVLQNKKEKNVVFNWYLDKTSDSIEGSVIDLTNIQKTSQALQQSEQKYRLIYEETNDAILLLENDKIIEVNRKATQLFGITQENLIGTNLLDLSYNLSEVNRKKYVSNIQRLENVKSIKFNWAFKGKSKLIEAEVTLIEITIGKKLFYQCVIHDNTESYTSLRALKKNQRNLENILANNPEGILIVKEREILYINSSAKKLLGETIDFHALFDGEDQLVFEKQYDQHQEDKKTKNGQLTINGTDILTDVTIVLTDYEDEEAVLIILKDVSAQNKLDKEKLRAEFAEEANKALEKEIKERIKTEQLLEEQYLRTKAIIDSSNYTFLLTINLRGEITSFNKHLENYIKKIANEKITLGENYKNIFKKITSEQKIKGFEVMLNTLKKGTSHKFEVQLISNGNIFWLEVFMSPIFDTKGDVIEVSMVAHDSSEKKQISLNISESLKEKEVLLKEIHHRVKNNLQVISSILNLQSSFVTDENTLDILQESRNRIRTMAIIHENLYRTEDFSSINFSSYLENLLGNLVASYRINEEVELVTNLKEVDLVLDQAIPCGLLVNELITNALKYAWKQGEKGKITINLFQEESDIHLNIFDDGIGLPFDFKKNKPDTLGLQLVETLVEQLDGEIDVINENGTKYFIRFEYIKS